MRAWLTALALLFVAWLCGCATWADEDAFDRLVAAFASAQARADRGDQEAIEFLSVMDFWTRSSRITRLIRRLPDDYTVATLKCYEDGGVGSVELPVPHHQDNTVTAERMLKCIDGLNPRMSLSDVMPVHAMWEFCLNYITDGDHRIEEMEREFEKNGVKEPLCVWEVPRRVEDGIDFDAEEFSATDLALTLLGLQEVPKSGWNWAWINANILGGISRDHTFPGCTLCNGAPIGGDK